MTDGPNMKPEPLTMSRLFAIPREPLFRAWSSVSAVKAWFCPKDCTVFAAEMDFRPGGAFNIGFRLADGAECWTRSIYTEIVVPERLVSTSQISESGRPLFNCQTTLIFTPAGAGTRLEVQRLYDIIDPLWANVEKGFKTGWSGVFNRLAASVSNTMKDKKNG
jgi:uncharacterized protein YndB with AHSA1/START domain